MGKAVTVSGGQHWDSATCIRSPPQIPSHPDFHMALSRIPCAIQQDLVGHPF